MEVKKKLDSSKPLTVIFTWNTTTHNNFLIGFEVVP